MKYSNEFKEKVLHTFGDREDIKKMLDNGNEFLGRILDDSSYGNFSPEEIIEACESLNLQQLYNKAKRIKALKELYREWLKMYREQYNIERSI